MAAVIRAGDHPPAAQTERWVRLGFLLSATLIVIFAPGCSSGGTYGACKDAVRKQLTHPESVEFTEIESYQGPSSLTGEQLNLVEGR